MTKSKQRYGDSFTFETPKCSSKTEFSAVGELERVPVSYARASSFDRDRLPRFYFDLIRWRRHIFCSYEF